MHDDDMTTIDAPNQGKPAKVYRETARSRAAYNDYVALGPGRSLNKLLQTYLATIKTEPKSRVPTNRMATLTHWSSQFGWQARLGQMEQAQSDAIAKHMESERARVFGDSLALDFERVQRLIAKARMIEDAIGLDVAEMQPRRIEVLMGVYRGLLDDIAREVGGRIQRSTINLKAIKDEAAKIADELGLDPDSVLAEAEALIRARQKGNLS